MREDGRFVASFTNTVPRTKEHEDEDVVSGARVERPRHGPSLFWVAIALLLASISAAVGWAGSIALHPAEEALAVAPFTFVKVADGEVGASVALNAVAQWTPRPIGVNRAAGIVTSVDVTAGDEVTQGAVLYTVGLRPVVVAQGKVPAFREIGRGSEGPDVEQLQTMLAELGLYAGPADGRAGGGTVDAIAKWQRGLGVTPTGVVEPGDVVFVDALPARVMLNGELVARGATLGGGEDVLLGLPKTPRFTVRLTEGQAAKAPPGTRVEIASPSGATWVALAGKHTPRTESGAVSVVLVGDGDASICGDQCGELSVMGEAVLPARVVTVETVRGLVVPSAALTTGAGGALAVIDKRGERIPVKVVAAARGMSVIEGAMKGTAVRLPAVDEK